MEFEYLEHTADAKFKAYGKTKEQIFSNAALAMFNIIVDTKKVKKIKSHTFEITAKTDRGLLYDFLDELLYLHDTEGFVLSKIVSLKIDNNILKAEVVGDSYKNYETHGHIKAVTYNDFDLTDNYVIMVMDL